VQIDLKGQAERVGAKEEHEVLRRQSANFAGCQRNANRTLQSALFSENSLGRLARPSFLETDLDDVLRQFFP
jgi:hypothetical protein